MRAVCERGRAQSVNNTTLLIIMQMEMDYLTRFSGFLCALHSFSFGFSNIKHYLLPPFFFHVVFFLFNVSDSLCFIKIKINL